MPGTAVGLYCAVVDRFDLLVPTRTMAARETQAVFHQRAESLRRWLRALNLGSGVDAHRSSSLTTMDTSDRRSCRPQVEFGSALSTTCS